MAGRAAGDDQRVRVHLLGLPHVETNPQWELDGFAMLTLRFAEVLRRLDCEVWLYGAENNSAPCSHFVRCITKEEQKNLLGDGPYQRVSYDAGNPLFVTFNARAQAHLATVKGPHDVICTLAGSAQMPVAQQHSELTCLEYSIGYRGVFAPFRVYQSHAWRHIVHGYTGMDHGRPFDAVIPPGYNLAEFPARRPEGYVAFVGRLDAGKGLALACKAAQAAGVRLVVVGHGDSAAVTYGDYLGPLSNAERNHVLAGAQAVLMPTRYLEPFGQVAAEAQLCGTPVIGPDVGAFTETVVHGETGYHCAVLQDFVAAIDQSRYLDRAAIRARAQRLWSLETMTESYRAYFARLELRRQEGFDTLPVQELTVG
jgi:glycosyltransferase involved in cell wall biosynthesis